MTGTESGAATGTESGDAAAESHANAGEVIDAVASVIASGTEAGAADRVVAMVRATYATSDRACSVHGARS